MMCKISCFNEVVGWMENIKWRWGEKGCKKGWLGKNWKSTSYFYFLVYILNNFTILPWLSAVPDSAESSCALSVKAWGTVKIFRKEVLKYGLNCCTKSYIFSQAERFNSRSKPIVDFWIMRTAGNVFFLFKLESHCTSPI